VAEISELTRKVSKVLDELTDQPSVLRHMAERHPGKLVDYVVKEFYKQTPRDRWYSEKSITAELISQLAVRLWGRELGDG